MARNLSAKYYQEKYYEENKERMRKKIVKENTVVS